MGKKKKKKKKLVEKIGTRKQEKTSPPSELTLRLTDPGLFFGGLNQRGRGTYIGIPKGKYGHAAVVGSTGSCKTSGIVRHMLLTHDGTAVVVDPKGELSKYYQEAYEAGLVSRPYMAFDPSDPDTVSYDPYRLFSADTIESDVLDMVNTIIPKTPNAAEPFWNAGEQQTTSAFIYHFYHRGLSFSETLNAILNADIQELCGKLYRDGDIVERQWIGQTAQNPKMATAIERGLRNHLSLFAVDRHIAHAFRGQREGAKVFHWDDLNEHVIFLKIPADKIEVWRPAINLMLVQLIRFLERRPDQHEETAKEIPQTVLLLDEFARLGKIPMIGEALDTLRSKKATFVLVLQSLAQLDELYGEYKRRDILDNCQYLAILRSNDADTQAYLARRIGTALQQQHGLTEQLDESFVPVGYSFQTAEVREYKIQPEDLSTMDDIVLLSPFGCCHLDKLKPDYDFPGLLADYKDPAQTEKLSTAQSRQNSGAQMLRSEQRMRNAEEKLEAYDRAQRMEQEKRDREAQIDQFVEALQLNTDSDDSVGKRTAVLQFIARDPELVKLILESKTRQDTNAGVIVK